MIQIQYSVIYHVFIEKTPKTVLFKTYTTYNVTNIERGRGAQRGVSSGFQISGGIVEGQYAKFNK